MTEEGAVAVFEECSAIERGHFLLQSGLHSDTYVNKRRIIWRPHHLRRLCDSLSDRFMLMNPTVVVAPERGGTSMVQWVAYRIRATIGQTVLAITVEKTNAGELAWRGGAEKEIDGRECLVIDDITTTGDSLLRTIKLVQEARGQVVGAGVLWNRGNLSAESLGVPAFHALVNQEIPAWDAGTGSCPLCKEGVPLSTHIGHGTSK